MAQTKSGSDTQGIMDATLRDLREALHRRGRLSSRNEALDELCKLLFAHVISATAENRTGISKENIFRKSGQTSGAASALKEYVADSFNRYLPPSLAHEMKPSDFELKLKSQEDVLAIEIIECFERLTSAIEDQEMDGFRDIDLLNDVFGRFLAGSFIDEKELGQYLTPTEVVDFMVQLAINDMSESELRVLLDPQHCSQYGLILDPSCGVGSFLTELLKTLRDKVAGVHGEQNVRPWLNSMVSDVVTGIDKSERMVRLAMTNMALSGSPAARLHLANSLARSGADDIVTDSLHGRVNLILTNPPFGAEFGGEDLSKYQVSNVWARRSPTKANSEILFMERYLDWLMPGGRLLAIVPDSILTNKGLFEDLRRGLADKVEIRSVVSLPVETFGTTGTNTKTSVLYLRKRRSEELYRSAAYFAMCRNVGYSVVTRGTQKKKVASGESELPQMLREFSTSEPSAKLGRWVRNAETTKRWDATYHSSLPLEIGYRLDNPSATDVFVSSVARLSADKVDPRKWASGTFRYIEISDVDPRTCMVETKDVPCSEAPSRARKLVRAGDVLFSTVRPDRRVVGVVREGQDGAVCTTGFAVLRPHGVEPLLLAHLLKADFVTVQVLRNNIGIAYPAVEGSCLPEILLPINREDLHSMKYGADAVMILESEVREARKRLGEEIEGAIRGWHQKSNLDPKPRRSNQTKSHRQSRIEGFDEHDRGI